MLPQITQNKAYTKLEPEIKNKSHYFNHTNAPGESLVFCQLMLSIKTEIIFRKVIFTQIFYHLHQNDIHRSSMQIRKSGVMAAFWWHFIIHRGNKPISAFFKLVGTTMSAELGVQSDLEVWLGVAIIFWTLLFFLETHSNPSQNPVTFPGTLSLAVSLDNLTYPDTIRFLLYLSLATPMYPYVYIIEQLYIHGK